MTQLELIKGQNCVLWPPAWPGSAFMVSTSPFSPRVSILEMGQKAVESWTGVGQQWLRDTWLLGWIHGQRAFTFPSSLRVPRAAQGLPRMSQYGQAVKAKSPLYSLFSAEHQEALCSNSSLAPWLESGRIIHPSVAGPKGHHCPVTSL